MDMQNTDYEILQKLQKMNMSQRFKFAAFCLKALPLSQVFSSINVKLFHSTIDTALECLKKRSVRHELDELIVFLLPQCELLHKEATATLNLVNEKYTARARSYAVDAIYSYAEMVYHHAAQESCPIQIAHVLEKIHLCQQVLYKADKAKLSHEILNQSKVAESILNNVCPIHERTEKSNVIPFPQRQNIGKGNATSHPLTRLLNNKA